MGKRSVKVSLLAFVSLLFISACSAPNVLRQSQPAAVIPIDLPLQTQAQLRDFDLAVKSIQSQYINQKTADTWKMQSASFRTQVSAGMDDSEFVITLSSLLAKMNDSDLYIVRPTSQAAVTATTDVTSAFNGIGIIASLPVPDRKRMLIMNVLLDSPAADAGLKPHDSIVQIDGKSVNAAEGSAAVLVRLRGPAGSTVTLTIHTPGKDERDVVVTRRVIVTQSTFTYSRVPGTNIGYIEPDGSTTDGMRAEISQALRELSAKEGLDGLILDLRIIQNPDFPVTDILGLFANGNAGTLLTRTGKTKVDITGKNIAGSQELPLVVLVSDQTSGVAESFAGMLQDLGRARVVGTQTGGRLAIISKLSLPNTSADILIPTGEYRGVKDKSWYGAGVKPDLSSDLKWEDFTSEDDSQLKQAVKALTRQ
jgi:carboxyl-terminal processing protease